jgi:hypothetical protein
MILLQQQVRGEARTSYCGICCERVCIQLMYSAVCARLLFPAYSVCMCTFVCPLAQKADIARARYA